MSKVLVKAWKAYLYACDGNELLDETLINENSEGIARDIFSENHSSLKNTFITLEETTEEINEEDAVESDLKILQSDQFTFEDK